MTPKTYKHRGLFSRLLNNDRVGSSPEDISWFKNTTPIPIIIYVMNPSKSNPDPLDYISTSYPRAGFILAPDNFAYFVDPFYRDPWTRLLGSYSERGYKIFRSRGEVEMGFYRVCTNKKHNVSWDDLLQGYDNVRNRKTLLMRQGRMSRILVDRHGHDIRAKFISGIDDAPPWLLEYKLGQMFS
jgi:hypothetical protein